MKKIILIIAALAMYASAMNCIEAVFNGAKMFPMITEFPLDSFYMGEQLGTTSENIWSRKQHLVSNGWNGLTLYLEDGTRYSDVQLEIVKLSDMEFMRIAYDGEIIDTAKIFVYEDSIASISKNNMQEFFVRGDTIYEHHHWDINSEAPQTTTRIYVSDPMDSLSCIETEYYSYPYGQNNPMQISDTYQISVSVSGDTIFIKEEKEKYLRVYVFIKYPQDGTNLIRHQKVYMNIPKNVRLFDLKGRNRQTFGKYQKTFIK